VDGLRAAVAYLLEEGHAEVGAFFAHGRAKPWVA
jgi:hypothetical protein